MNKKAPSLTSSQLFPLGPKTGEVEERWGDPTAAGRDGQERGGSGNGNGNSGPTSKSRLMCEYHFPS